MVNSWQDKITEEGIHLFGRPRHLRFEPPLQQVHECSCHVGRHRCKQFVRHFSLSLLSQALLHTRTEKVLERLNHDLETLPSQECLKETLLLSKVLQKGQTWDEVRCVLLGC